MSTSNATNLSELEEKYNNLARQFENFSYIVSHELRAPLRHIREFTKIFLEDIAPDTMTDAQKEAAKYIALNAESSEAMIDGLLNYSRLNTRKNNFTENHSEEIISYILFSYVDQLEQHKTILHKPSTYPTIIGDNKQLTMMMQHIIDNALKFSADQAQPEVKIEFTETSSEVTFTVSDNGIGIDPAFHAKIFDLFKRLEPSYPGTGVGLTLAQRIVERHNGRIRVESEAGKGATFIVALPKQAILPSQT